MIRRRRQGLFRLLVASAGWGLSIVAAVAAPSEAIALSPSLVVLIATVLVTRALAYQVTELGGTGRVSVDMAIYVAATAVLGIGPTAVGVATLLGLDSLLRARHRGQLVGQALAQGLYYGGLTGGVLTVGGRAFGYVGPGAIESAPELLSLAAFGLLALSLHYVLQGVDHWLSTGRMASTVQRVARGLLPELLLVPLGCGIALVWAPDAPLGVALLGVTYALINYGVGRIAAQQALLRRRLQQLEALNHAAHELSATLERDTIIRTLFSEGFALLPDAKRIELQTVYDGRGESIAQQGASAPSTTRVLDGLELEALLASSAVPSVDGGRIVVPMVVHDELRGQLIVDLDPAVAARSGHELLRLVDALSVQAIGALENARLYELANFDGLTGLYVRRYFDRRISEETERARRFQAPFAVVMLDIDNFKQLNDSRGHLAGDRVLRAVALAATTHLRGVDLAARYGGEELAFLLPRTSLADAHAVAERIRARIESLQIPDGDRTLRVTASLGVAAWSDAGRDDPAHLVGRADEALYRAKRGGKNRVEVDLGGFELTPSLAPVRRRAVP